MLPVDLLSISFVFSFYGDDDDEDDDDHDCVWDFILNISGLRPIIRTAVTGLSIPDDEEESVLSTVPGPFYLLISALLAPISKMKDKR